jgi:hypothetical protein
MSVGGGGGGSKPAPTPVSAGEKIQTKLAQDQIAHYRGTYAPLEQEFVRTVDQDPSARLAGQNATASAREMTGTLQQAAAGGGVVDTAAMAEARTLGRVGGMAQGTRELADGRMEALGVGLGATADASRSLSQAGQIQTSAAIDKTRSALAIQQAKNDEKAALMGAVGSLGGMYLGYKAPQWMGKYNTQQKALGEAKRQQTLINTGNAYKDARGIS